MRLRDDELLGLRVETSAGRRVGRLVGFVIDAETGFVVQYRVHPKGIIAALVPGTRELLISHDQVVSIDARRMIVREGAVPDAGGGRRRVAPAIQPQALIRQDS